MQKYAKDVNIIDLVKSFQTSINYLVAKIGFDTAEEPGNASMREPHGKGAAKPRKKQQKRPRSFWHDRKQNIVK